MNFLSGYKAYVGGLLAVVTGIGMILKTIKDGEFSFETIKEALAMIAGGISVIGGRHALEKAKDAVVKSVEASGNKGPTSTP